MSCIKTLLIPFWFFFLVSPLETHRDGKGWKPLKLFIAVPGNASTWCACLGLLLTEKLIQLVLHSCEFTNTHVQPYSLFLTSKATSQCSCPGKSARLFPLCTLSSSATYFASHSHLWAQRAAQPASQCYKGTPPHRLKDLLISVALKHSLSQLWLSWSPFMPARLVKNNICIIVTDFPNEQCQGGDARTLVQLGR